MVTLVVLAGNALAWYQPEQGRWASRDPIGEESHRRFQNLWGVEEESEEHDFIAPENHYNFCLNDSLNYYDVNGEWVGPAIRIGRAIVGPIVRGIGRGMARTQARKILECEAIHATYKALNCKGCDDCTYKEEAAVRAACLTAEIGGRQLYLKKKCDFILPGSIARGSKKAEAGHRAEVANKTKALVKCLAKTTTLPPTPIPPTIPGSMP